MSGAERHAGVGIEVTHRLLRAIRIADDRPVIAAEVQLRNAADDQSMLEAFIRLRAELGSPKFPTRIATFPARSSMRRIDVTGRTGPELNELRADVERQFGVSSSVLVDNGPRRWMYVLQWDSTGLRRLEDMAERAGFGDATVDPSPLALARVCGPRATILERVAAADEAFVVAMDGGVPVAAASTEGTGKLHPNLVMGSTSFSVALFEDVVDAEEISDQIGVIDLSQRHVDGAVELEIAGEPFEHFPPHDLRASERQCVALGAAVGAAGLSGRLRPVDIVTVESSTAARRQRPWAIERMSNLEPPSEAVQPGSVRRFTARLRPRRHPR